MRWFVIFTMMFAISGSCFAGEICESGRGIQTAFGRLVSTDCFDHDGHVLRQWLALDGVKFLEDGILSREDRDGRKGLWIYSGKAAIETGCSARIYLVDLSFKPVKVIAFGVKKACNEFHWASWGGRSAIAIKNNVKFFYENGEMTLPEKGRKLWLSIEPPHGGAGLLEGDAIPFAYEMPIPR